jgi:ABC-type sugar transport system, ATPase component
VPLVRLVNAGKRYGAVIALHDINMEVGAGEVTCVLGDNGAGKSTLIKIIAGLHQPSTGTYEVEGTPVPLLLPPRGARARHRHRLPGPGRGGADAGLA